MRAATSLVLSLIWASDSVAYECPAIADREWEFVGHIVTQTYPGPPDYESISGGDKPLTRWFLQLPRAVCFRHYHHQYLFQLLLTPEDFERYRQFLGKEIRIKGRLEEAAAGDHRTRLVLNVSSLDRVGTDHSYVWPYD